MVLPLVQDPQNKSPERIADDLLWFIRGNFPNTRPSELFFLVRNGLVLLANYVPRQKQVEDLMEEAARLHAEYLGGEHA